MRYEDKERREKMKHDREVNIARRAEIYFKSQSFYEYRMKATLECLISSHKWQDIFWWHYNWKNNHVKFIMCCFLASATLAGILALCSLSIFSANLKLVAALAEIVMIVSPIVMLSVIDISFVQKVDFALIDAEIKFKLNSQTR